MPSIAMMIFTSIYSVVDGFFVSNYAGKEAFAAINLVWPFLGILFMIGYISGSGGTAVVSQTLGEKDEDRACCYLFMITAAAVAVSVVLSVLGFVFIREISIALGASGKLITYCVRYSRVLIPFVPFYVLQAHFQALMVAAERPKLGFLITLLSGLTNIFLDFLFVGVFKWSLEGAALASGGSMVIGGGIPLIFFMVRNGTPLRFKKAPMEWKIIAKAATNGASEFIANVSISISSFAYNLQLLKYVGADGVAAYGVIMYVNFIFMAVFFGYGMGSAPIIGYNFGARTYGELKNVFFKSLKLMATAGVLLTGAALALAGPLAYLYTGYDHELYLMTRHAFACYSTAFVFMGINVYASAYFTALGNGLVSGIISSLRTLVFQLGAVLILPGIFGIEGIWFAVCIAEILTLFVTIGFFLKENRKLFPVEA